MELDSLFKPETLKAALAELIGTFFLTLAALISGNNAAIAVALVLTACVYAIGDVSGSHVNPAVTLGLLVDRHIPAIKGGLYIIAQIVGALLASLVGGIAGKLAPSYQSADAILEFFGFGILMITVVAVYEKNVPKAGSGIAIGAALAAGLLTTGGILNPAVAIAMKQTNSPGTWAPLLSAILFATIFKFFFLAKPKE
jgi:aquaporin Z